MPLNLHRIAAGICGIKNAKSVFQPSFSLHLTVIMGKSAGEVSRQASDIDF